MKHGMAILSMGLVFLALPLQASESAGGPMPIQLAAATPSSLPPGPDPIVPETRDARGQRASNRNLFRVESKLAVLIRELNEDKDDYGGLKAKAVRDMTEAHQEILSAEDYAKKQQLQLLQQQKKH